MGIRHLLLGLVVFMSTGCNQHQTDNKTHQHETSDAKKAEEATATLTLNEGKKWKLDEPTRENMKAIRETFQKAGASPDYTALAVDLQDKSNKLVSECKMSGKHHDMLHVWLTDYLSSLKEMNSTDKVAQETAFHKLESQLKNFDLYFE
jgi:hypothetical protein